MNVTVPDWGVVFVAITLPNVEFSDCMTIETSIPCCAAPVESTTLTSIIPLPTSSSLRYNSMGPVPAATLKPAVVVAVTAVKAGPLLTGTQRIATQTMLGENRGQQELQDMLGYLKAEAKVSLKASNPAE